MTLPSNNTPLYNHSLMAIETWLQQQGCEQDEQDRNLWRVVQASWTAALELDVEKIIVSYEDKQTHGTVQRIFPYSLSRQDLENAIFAGP
ncbi:MAG: DUF3143 domain-containing protein [Synechococcales cyanobacterium RU_4_20]|nr:DUF3143 domain-containing protein [Synechococcales cyanobacterium RU_4_20]NJR67408.1 DUF3143 domain-containing protein [Synechococcales cyanobacterium CRU_2_2]